MISRSKEETYKTAFDLAKSLRMPAHVLLYGDLGAGKTVFAKGLAEGFGGLSCFFVWIIGILNNCILQCDQSHSYVFSYEITRAYEISIDGD